MRICPCLADDSEKRPLNHVFNRFVAVIQPSSL